MSGERYRFKKGVIPKEEYLKKVKKYHTKEERMAKKLSILKAWVEKNGGHEFAKKIMRQTYARRRDKELLRSNHVTYPPEHIKWRNRQKSNYVNWWKRTLYRRDHPAIKQVSLNGQPLLRKIRKRLKRVLETKIGHKTRKLIGCNSHFLKSHLENQFNNGMSWDNHGTHWHIDHIIPLSKFDLTNEFQLLQACHYSNLQPLLAKHNLNKSAHILNPVQTHLPIQIHQSTTQAPKSKKSKFHNF